MLVMVGFGLLHAFSASPIPAGPVSPGGYLLHGIDIPQHEAGAETTFGGNAPAGGPFSWEFNRRTVVGTPRRHLVAGRETLLDIARTHGLGFNELADLYPAMDPWLPTAGEVVTIPSQWVLPDTEGADLVINIAELRLYRFAKTAAGVTVETFPVGIGDRDYPTPTGKYRISTKIKDPTWSIPPSLRGKYDRAAIPPGPHNPLGRYWMGLDGTHMGLHGTDIPWSVGRLVTHGCIRLYPEDIARLFRTIALPSRVRLIYEPVKIGVADGRVYVEVHRDVYGLLDDFTAYGFDRLQASGWRYSVDTGAFQKALEERCGLPVDVTAPSIARAASDVSQHHVYPKPEEAPQ